MSGVDAETGGLCLPGSTSERGKYSFRRGCAENLCIWLGVKLDAIRAQFAGELDFRIVVIHKQADANSCAAQLADDLAQSFLLLFQIPSVIGRELTGRIGNK